MTRPEIAVAENPAVDALRRIRGEYLEMPGLRLTCAQAQRLWGLEPPICATLLQSLVEEKFLYRADNGMFARMSDGAAAFPPLRMAKADVGARPAGHGITSG